MLAVLWPQWALGLALSVVSLSLQFTLPLCIGRVVAFLEDEGGTPHPLSEGLALAGVVLAASLAYSFTSNFETMIMQTIGLQMRHCLQTQVYGKALKKGTSQLGDQGKCVNMLSTDAQIFLDYLPILNNALCAPFLIIIAVSILCYEMGVYGLVAAAFPFFVLPVTITVARKIAARTKAFQGCTDSRVRLMNELMHGIRIIKYYAWERPFLRNISAAREKELRELRGLGVLRTCNVALMQVTPSTLMFLILLVMYLAGAPLTSTAVFTTLSLVNIMRQPLFTIGMAFNFLTQCKVSLNRIQDFTGSDDLNTMKAVNHAPSEEAPEEDETRNTDAVPLVGGKNSNYVEPMPIGPPSASLPSNLVFSLEHATFTWTDGTVALSDITVSVRRGELMMVIGRVGSGKSALVQALLSELPLVSGSCHITSEKAYVPQRPWILNLTLRDNILFGNPLNEEMYQNVIDVCALRNDLEQAPGGDQCEIGERGIAISGGQKQRVSIARAVYFGAVQDEASSTDRLYMLDDPLSATDAHVGAEVFERCLAGTLHGATRVLVTNDMHILARADSVVVLEAGRVTFWGTYAELLQSDIDLADIAAHQMQSKSPVEGGSGSSSGGAPQKGVSLYKQEEKEEGNIPMSTYWQYLRLGGVVFLGLILFGYANRYLARVANNLWLSKWPSDDDPASAVNGAAVVSVQGALVAYEALAVAFTSASWVVKGVRSSRALHAQLLESLAHSTVRFFDSTPVGRLINRFSKDMSTVDQRLPNTMEMAFGQTTNTLIIVTGMCIADWWSVVPLIPLALVYLWVQHRYRRAVIELRRIEGLSRSPIYIHFDGALSGLPCVRAYGAAERFACAFDALVDENARALYTVFVCKQWFAQRLQWIGVAIQMVTLGSLFVGKYFASLDPGLCALALANMSSVTQALAARSQSSAEAEQTMQSVERIMQYAHNPREEDRTVPHPITVPPDDAWPSRGEIVFDNVDLRYAQDLPLVLKGVTFSIKPGEKIGVVGRTGCGKSTLAAALFRFVDAECGSILIDGVDTRDVPLERLRSRLVIVPQEPTLFSGTVR
eukprot:TRINITY_DN3350_c0_g1_i1.p1 TRINITY_DN3350_c0_g1~~TRINITY_DN3350_c0_g1_i1.p1  ORF type:complete len:1129 (-),score=255.83 TRINITY_DN3350_c0_g1_i1:649-3834(-)